MGGPRQPGRTGRDVGERESGVPLCQAGSRKSGKWGPAAIPDILEKSNVESA